MMKNTSIDKDIFLVIVLTIIGVALTLVLPSDWVPGRILTLPLVLVLPGYALTTALFPKRIFGISQRLVFSLALSLVIAVLGGILLNFTPWGLHAGPWAVFLGGITLVACVVALVRRRAQNISSSAWLRHENIRLNFRQGLLLSLAVFLVGGAIAMSIIGAEHQPSPGFTQLWILPGIGADAKTAVRLGVKNMESTAMEYTLTVNVDGKPVKEWLAIDLNPNEQWETTLSLPPTGQIGSTEIEANLYRADAPTTIYRHVVLWLGT
jgi:uncharacterized membrane protein